MRDKKFSIILISPIIYIEHDENDFIEESRPLLILHQERNYNAQWDNTMWFNPINSSILIQPINLLLKIEIYRHGNPLQDSLITMDTVTVCTLLLSHVECKHTFHTLEVVLSYIIICVLRVIL